MIHLETLNGNGPRLYSDFCRSVYKGRCRNYRDSMSPLLGLVLDDRSEFGKRSDRTALLARDSSGSPVAASVLCRAHADPSVLQIAFFEALPDQQEAVDAIVDSAREQAGRMGAKTIVAGLNGHVNYGLGFLADKHDAPPCFGSSCNPDYYLDYFAKHAASEETLVSYTYDMAAASFDGEKRLLDRVLSRFTFREANFADLESEVRLYTKLNNECFAHHPLYAQRTFEEDYELFKPFSSLLGGKNFLIAEAGGEPVGFLLWYPDFNELVPPGKGVGLSALVKLKVFRRKIDRFKIAEIGVLPKYQGTGVIVGLIRKCFELARASHGICESGWVFDDNADSQSICRRWKGEAYKTYKVFRIST